MSQINDAIVAVVGPGDISDGLLTYYQARGATSNDLQDAEREYLLAAVPSLTGTLNDMWFTALRSAGFLGALDDMLLAFWLGGGFDPAPAPIWTTDPPVPDVGDVGVPYSYDLTPDLNTIAGVVITVTGAPLPSGLAIVGLTIAGTPDTPIEQTGIQLTATNGSGADESLPFGILINPSDPLGPELLDDPTFNQDAGQWSLQAGWTIAANTLTAAPNATATNGAQHANPAPLLEDGKTYRITADTVGGSYAGEGLHLQFNGVPSQSFALADGSHSVDILTTNTQTIFRFRIANLGDFQGSIENASCKEIL